MSNHETLVITPDDFFHLRGSDKQEALLLFRERQNEYTAKRHEIKEQYTESKGFLFHQYNLKLANELRMIIKRYGLRFFGPTYRLPLKKNKNVLMPKFDKVQVRIMDQYAYVMVHRRWHYYKSLLRWMTMMFSLNVIRPKPVVSVFRVKRPLFDQLYEPRLEPK